MRASIMKLCLQIALVIMAIFTNIAPVFGITCQSACAACEKNSDDRGTETIFTCNGDCGDTCPNGYHRIKCVPEGRCK